MTSNAGLNAASRMTSITENVFLKSSYHNASESETEDEEVRMNCVGGFRGIEDSDMNTTENSDNEDDDALTDDEASRDEFRVTLFVTNPYMSEVPLIRPKPKPAGFRRLSPLEEAEDEPENIDEQTNVEAGSISYDTLDSKSDIIEVDSCDTGISEHYGLAEKSMLDPCPQSYDDAELTEIMVSIGDALELVLDESESSSRLCYLGVMKDTEASAAFMRGPKRVQDDRSDCVGEVCKKARSVTIDLQTVIRPVTLLQNFLVGQSDRSCSLSSFFAIKIREESPALMSSDDDDDLDRQLGEELGDQYQGDGQETPVPLLTPPGSPLTVEWEGASTTLCEWPSNLIVDNALQAVNELRPMSPTSLENLERDEHDRIVAFSSGKNNGNEFMMITPSTPMLKSVYA